MANLSEVSDLYLRGRADRHEIALITVDSMRRNFAVFIEQLGDPPIDEIDLETIERWRATVDLAPATVRLRLSQLRGLFQWAAREGHVRRDPTAGVGRVRQPRRLPRALPLEEVCTLMDACHDERAELILELMFQEGLRCVEVSRLNLEDVHWIEKLMVIRGKGGHERILPITAETMLALQRYLSVHPATAGPLVRSYNDPHRGLTPSYISAMVSRWMRDAGVKKRAFDGKSAHAGRHTCATDMLRRGAHLRDVQSAMGHASIATTQHYMPLVVGDLRSAMEGRSYRHRDEGEDLADAS